MAKKKVCKPLALTDEEKKLMREAALRVYRSARTNNEETLAYLLMRILGAPDSYITVGDE